MTVRIAVSAERYRKVVRELAALRKSLMFKCKCPYCYEACDCCEKRFRLLDPPPPAAKKCGKNGCSIFDRPKVKGKR